MRVQEIKYSTPKMSFLKQKHKNGSLNVALEELKKIKLGNNDLVYMKAIGANAPFKNGMEAYEFIKNNNINVIYGKMPMEDVHAIYSNSKRAIIINEKYRNSINFPQILALSEAIFHEAGHAKDLDSDNSIQEELDCLALNALAHRFHKKEYPDIFAGQNSFLFSEGVSLYEKLFYEFDTQKTNLQKRIINKYGFLPMQCEKHPQSEFVKNLNKIPNRAS